MPSSTSNSSVTSLCLKNARNVEASTPLPVGPSENSTEKGGEDTSRIIARKYGLKSRYARLRASGLLTLEEVADRLGCSIATMKKKRREGRLPFGCQKLNDEGEFMHEDPLAMKASKSANVSTRTHEVQKDR